MGVWNEFSEKILHQTEIGKPLERGTISVGGSSCYLKMVSVSHMLPDLWLLSRAVLGLHMPLFPSFSDRPVQFPRAQSLLFSTTTLSVLYICIFPPAPPFASISPKTPSTCAVMASSSHRVPDLDEYDNAFDSDDDLYLQVTEHDILPPVLPEPSR